MRSLIALAGLAVWVAFDGPAQMPPQDWAAVGSYRAALNGAKASRTPGALEATLERLDAVREALMRVHENGSSTLLETLSEADFQRLERDLPGVLLNREEILFVKPDPDYFLDFAATHGDGADRSFFAAYKQTYPDGVWPVYVSSQTDYSGCTAFGEGGLVAAYRTWADYRRTHSRRYVALSQAETERVSSELTESTCACGNAASVKKELQQFLRAFARSPIAGSVRNRLRALQDGRSGIRLRCHSG